MKEPRTNTQSAHEKDRTDSKCIPVTVSGLCRHLVSTVRLASFSRLPLLILTLLNTVYQPFILLALKRWFSDFEAHVLALGGKIKPWDVSQHFSGLVFGSPAYIQPEARCLPKHPNIPSDGKVPQSLYLSRVRFEPLLRRLVKEEYPGVTFVRGTVTGLILDATKKRVTGIEYTGEMSESVNLECALFVDCTGMARLGIKWLQKAGVPPPKVITYNAKMRYGFSECFQSFLLRKVGYISYSISPPAHTTVCQR